MGSFSNNAITDAGRRLLGDVQMGAVFTPTKIVMGSGDIPPGKTSRTITQVTKPVVALKLNKKKKSNDGTVLIGGTYSNEEVREDFYFKELALYAKSVKDGVASEEVLYSYGNAGDTADFMPAYSSGTPVERQIDLVIYIGNDTQVDLTVEHGLFVTREQVEEIVLAAIPKPKLTFDDLADEYDFTYSEENREGVTIYTETVKDRSPVSATRVTEERQVGGEDVYKITTTIDGIPVVKNLRAGETTAESNTEVM